jgi:hypothetical protein
LHKNCAIEIKGLAGDGRFWPLAREPMISESTLILIGLRLDKLHDSIYRQANTILSQFTGDSGSKKLEIGLS